MKQPVSQDMFLRLSAFLTAGRLSAFLILALSLGCSGRGHTSLTELTTRYDPVRIAKSVPAVPGSLAWSPDGKRLAFVSELIIIVDTVSLERKSVNIPHPVSLAWSEDNKLYVLSREQDATALFVVDPGKLSATKLPLDRDADMLYSLDPGSLILVAARLNSTRIGTELSWQLTQYALSTAETRTLSVFSKIYPWKTPDKELLLAWLHGGINPLDRSFLVMEHVKPPVLQPYTRVSGLDTLTGEETAIAGKDREGMYASACWSPDGKRVALTDMNNRLEIVIIGAEGATPIAVSAGRYPSWNPGGSIIYSGGSIIRSDGSATEQLLSNASASIGVWSPDGTRFAVAAGGELLLFRNFTPSFSGSDRPLDRALAEKLTLLRDFLAEELITRQQYDERKAGMLRTREDRP